MSDEPRQRSRQTSLSLEVGGDPDELISGSVKISGSLPIEEDLHRRARVTISVADADGKVVATGEGVVVGMPWKFHDKKGVEWTERVHSVKVIDE